MPRADYHHSANTDKKGVPWYTVAVVLREMGRSERDIAHALGHKTVEMARHYAKGADLRPKMRCMVKDFESELNKRRTKVVKPTA